VISALSWRPQAATERAKATKCLGQRPNFVTLRRFLSSLSASLRADYLCAFCLLTSEADRGSALVLASEISLRLSLPWLPVSPSAAGESFLGAACCLEAAARLRGSDSLRLSLPLLCAVQALIHEPVQSDPQAEDAWRQAGSAVHGQEGQGTADTRRRPGTHPRSTCPESGVFRSFSQVTTLGAFDLAELLASLVPLHYLTVRPPRARHRSRACDRRSIAARGSPRARRLCTAHTVAYSAAAPCGTALCAPSW